MNGGVAVSGFAALKHAGFPYFSCLLRNRQNAERHLASASSVGVHCVAVLGMVHWDVPEVLDRRVLLLNPRA